MRRENETPTFRQAITDAAGALLVKDLSGARAGIAEAMALNMDAPEPHNLLGALCELAGDYQAARRHYRAAYALDPAYRPCCRNLERVTGYDFSTKMADIDLGLGEKNGLSA